MTETEHAYTLSIEETTARLGTDPVAGLSGEEAASRLASHGPNELKDRPRRSLVQRLLAQFADFLILVLLTAGVVSALLGEWIDAGAILAIVVINAVLGIIQEGRAERAIEALRKMAAPTARVLRDGTMQKVPASALVPGDVVLVEAGDVVPADVRLVESVSLQIEEASLTGESVPVEKDAMAVYTEPRPLGDRANIAYMGTAVTYGSGRGIVTSTGAHTEIGRIAEKLKSMKEEATPLQKNLAQLGRLLGLLCLVVCAGVFLQGFLTGGDPLALFMTAISLAVAAIPEGLPAVVTIVLALGMRRMADRNAIVKRLPAVETLGGVDVICTDKTGTLTQNEMTVVRLYTEGCDAEVSGSGYALEGEIRDQDGTLIDPEGTLSLRRLLEIGALCNDAQLAAEKDGAPGIIGDPTEAAMLVAAYKGGIRQERIAAIRPRVAGLPFDSVRKRMTTFHEGFSDSPVLALVKGAPDLVIGRCVSLLTPDGIRPMHPEDRDRLLAANSAMGSEALRVLAFAYRAFDVIPDLDPEKVESDLVFAGLMGMIDPARPEARDAIAICRQAGIRVVMITGDHRETATAIARDLALMPEGSRVLDGSDLDGIAEEELRQLSESVRVYARVSPDHKVRIIEAIRANGHVASMTGDGVNDAMALKRADIGVAMGITGTEVAKGTADMILTDDHFATIVHAVEEGRIIYANIRKFVGFLLSCNIGEILVIFLSVLLLGPRYAPLAPLQLLWLNLLTDSFPALALGREPGEPDNMRRPPRTRDARIVDRRMIRTIAFQSVAIFGAVFAAFQIGRLVYPDVLMDGVSAPHDGARTFAFATLLLAELFRAFSARSENLTVFETGLGGNRSMVQAVALSGVLLLAILYLPFLSPLFSTVPLSLRDWLAIVPLALVPFAAGELQKVLFRKKVRID